MADDCKITMLKRVVLCCLAALMALCPVAEAEAEFSFGFLPVREYNGRTYEARPPAEITTILLIGYDHDAEGQLEELHGNSGGGQADLLLLVVLDHREGTVRTLQLDRDTMTSVRVTDARGYQHDRSSLQICLAHAYGNTREKNNANTVLAVEKLLGIDAADDGAQIDWYVAMDISGISRLNDLLGGVTLTFEEDMTDVDPAMTKGATLTLTGQQAERFCRGRYGVGDQTNASRMRRQRQYITAAGDQLAAKVISDTESASDLLSGMGIIYDRTMKTDDVFNFATEVEGTPNGDAAGCYLMTNARSSTIVAELSRAARYTMLEMETLPGVHSLGRNGYIRYDLEEDAAIRWTLDALYTDVLE